MATTHVLQEGLWLRSLFAELHISLRFPITIYLDNSGAIALSTAAKFHQRTKHIDLRYHFIREHVDNGSFTLIWVPTHLNVADVLTKALPRPAFTQFCSLLGLVSH